RACVPPACEQIDTPGGQADLTGGFFLVSQLFSVASDSAVCCSPKPPEAAEYSSQTPQVTRGPKPKLVCSTPASGTALGQLPTLNPMNSYRPEILMTDRHVVRMCALAGAPTGLFSLC